MAMPFTQRISQAARAALMGISTYAPPDAPTYVYDIDSPHVRQMREALGGQLVPATTSQIRWYLADLEAAERIADTGDLSRAGRLMLSVRKDGVIAGVLSTRTGGLVRLPKRFRGDPEVVSQLEIGHDSVRSTFDDMFPPSELALLVGDAILLGVAVAEFLPVQGRSFPVLCRLDPQYLQYVWNENRFYYRSAVGRLPVTPGDGRWLLHVPGGRVAPWQTALWRAIGKAYIRKEHANLHADNWQSKLANPARVATAPQGAAEPQKQSFFQQIMAWSINSVFGMTPGYSVQLLESNGRGFDAFMKTVEKQDTENIIALTGQTVTVSGGTGFANADIHQSIRADLIKDDADSLAYTINTQGIPVYVALHYGEEAIMTKSAAVEWDVTPPEDRNAEASSVLTLSSAITQMTTALSAHGMQLDVAQLVQRYGVPIRGDYDGDGTPDTEHGKPPALRLIQGGAGDEPVLDATPAADAAVTANNGADAGASPAGDAAAVVASGEASAADSALNGAQVQSLVEIVTAVVAGTLPRDAALAIIQRAFLVDAAAADEILGSAGKGFKPTPPPSAAPAPAAPVEGTVAA